MERHSRAEYHGAAEGAPSAFRFSRLGPENTAHPDDLLRSKLARIVGHGFKGDSGADIPAGYTYLGQFIDHDLTFDRTPLSTEPVPPAQLVSERSPTLDLDSLYGYGPRLTPQYYQDGVGKLRIGTTEARPGSPLVDREYAGHDLPRDPTQQAAVIPDLRNDENLFVAQLAHLPLIRLHNAFMDDLERQGVPADQRYSQARRLVILHYHWIVKNDYLPRVVDPRVVKDVFDHGRKVVDPSPVLGAAPTMPLEFSVACFRFGHSMVRGGYVINRDKETLLRLVLALSGTGGLLGRGRRLPSLYIPDLDGFYDFSTGPVGPGGIHAPSSTQPQSANMIDASISGGLTDLSDGAIGGPDPQPLRHHLVYRNLERAAQVRLATGQQMHRLLADRGVHVPRLTPHQVHTQLAQGIEGLIGDLLAELNPADRRLVGEHTPLWIYVLAEAGQLVPPGADDSRKRLTGVGGRIVTETVHRAMEATDVSLLREPQWRPSIGPNPRTCRMTDLVIYPFGTDVKRLAPVHDAPPELTDELFEPPPVIPFP